MTTAESGYTWCGCRDCFEIVIGPMDRPELCSDCQEAGCEIDNGECQRADAYGVCAHMVRRVGTRFVYCVDCGQTLHTVDIGGDTNGPQ
ncbi:hypothetical protein K7711_22650 [Nocardia sp. CA2R105]|uniref:hypothetical protein n=1 Tax=Nocardia coffeae TaxID=2873381 RepID=UPI001CA769C6|nr:hypothetical protein [Nocardia coffeae]MBY8859288.1 hypothetical protein [Nocardia coffeae]